MDFINLINPAMDILKYVGTTFKKHVKYQFCHEHYVHEFEEMRGNLQRRLRDVENELETQRVPGKIARVEVDDWLVKARTETAVMVGNLICIGGCFTHICSSRKLDKKTQALREGIFTEGGRYTNPGVSLVMDDLSIEYCSTVFKEKQEQLKIRRKDIQAKLETQLMQHGKIASKEVEDWLKKAGQQILVKVEDLISPGPSSSNLRTKTKELEQIFELGERYTNPGVSLVMDDLSIEHCRKVFEEKQEQLESRKKDIDAKLKTQLMQPGKIARKEVEDWLKKAGQQILVKVEYLISPGDCPSSSNLRTKTKELEQIFEQGEKYTNTSESLVMDDHSIKGYELPVEKCSGRDGEQKQILEWLKGDQFTRIAVCGMGGVGKTTIMKKVQNQLLKEPEFDGVIWIDVSRHFDIIVQQKKKFDILKFQKRIASSLRLKLESEDLENETKVAGLISQKLRQGSYVLILDDVWQKFLLEEVGVVDPDGNNVCKLVLTTRLQDVAREMDCEVIHVNPLPADKALALFLEKVGDGVLSNGKIKRDIEPFLKQILQKCGGVPLAIMTIAGTMKGKLDPGLWKWALSKLSKLERIVDCLKFSYECLEPNCQNCFLYCALYPEDYKIPMKLLIEYWIEEGFIYVEGETRDTMNCEGLAILKKLVDNCLLQSVKGNKGEIGGDDYDQEDFVGMHDLLREMALDICPHFLVKAGMGLEELPEQHEWREDLLKVSLMENHIREIPSNILSPKCPMLTTLLLSNNLFSTIPEAFFGHMLQLKILDLSNNFWLDRLPSSVSKLKKLTTLLLEGCESLREVPSLSNLGGLKKLDLCGTSIKELPQGLNMLTNLKYLGLGGELSEIPDGLLQNLSKLQHLKVDYNMPLKEEEIGRLGKLEYLKGWFPKVHDMSIFFSFGRKVLNKYDLIVGSSNGESSYSIDRLESKSILCLDIDICGEPDWLPPDVQRLMIRGCKDVRSLNDIPGFQDATNLQYVQILGCYGVEIALSLPLLSECNLEELNLFSLYNLNAVFGEVGVVAKSAPPPAGTYFSLRKIDVFKCDKIKKLFSVRWLWYLQNLEIIKVTWCEQMEEIIWSDCEGGEKVTLPNLQSLELTDLPKLKSIYSGSRTVLICDSIKTISIGHCHKIESVFWSGFNPIPTLESLYLDHLWNLKSVFDEEALGLLPRKPPTIFFSLKNIRVKHCHQLKKVFSFVWLLGYFQSLETIKVCECWAMEELISSSAYEEEKITLPNLQEQISSSVHEEEKVTLPKLVSLELTELPQLKSICSNSSVLICDSIERLQIVRCEKLKRIPLNFELLDNAQSSHPPSLKQIVVFPEEWWKSLEWDHPNTKDILLPFCEFRDDRTIN